MNHLVSAPKDTKKPSSALAKFEKATESWDPKQAKIAVAILAAVMRWDQGPFETMFGKGTSVQVAIGSSHGRSDKGSAFSHRGAYR